MYCAIITNLPPIHSFSFHNDTCSSVGDGNFKLFPAISEGLDKTCVNISLILPIDDVISQPWSGSIMLEKYKIFDGRIMFPEGHRNDVALTIEDDGK